MLLKGSVGVHSQWCRILCCHSVAGVEQCLPQWLVSVLWALAGALRHGWRGHGLRWPSADWGTGVRGDMRKPRSTALAWRAAGDDAGARGRRRRRRRGGWDPDADGRRVSGQWLAGSTGCRRGTRCVTARGLRRRAGTKSRRSACRRARRNTKTAFAHCRSCDFSTQCWICRHPSSETSWEAKPSADVAYTPGSVCGGQRWSTRGGRSW